MSSVCLSIHMLFKIIVKDAIKIKANFDAESLESFNILHKVRGKVVL